MRIRVLNFLAVFLVVTMVSTGALSEQSGRAVRPLKTSAGPCMTQAAH
jgi:hypothetical protein